MYMFVLQTPNAYSNSVPNQSDDSTKGHLRARGSTLWRHQWQRTPQGVWLDAVTTPVDKKHVDSCVRKHLFGVSSGTQESPNIPGNVYLTRYSCRVFKIWRLARQKLWFFGTTLLINYLSSTWAFNVCLSVCSSSPFLGPWGASAWDLGVFVFLKCLHLLLSLRINEHSQINCLLINFCWPAYCTFVSPTAGFGDSLIIIWFYGLTMWFFSLQVPLVLALREVAVGISLSILFVSL